MHLDKEYFEKKVIDSIDDKEKAMNLNNMLLFELLEYTKYINKDKNPKVEEVQKDEPVLHDTAGRKTPKRRG